MWAVLSVSVIKFTVDPGESSLEYVTPGVNWPACWSQARDYVGGKQGLLSTTYWHHFALGGETTHPLPTATAEINYNLEDLGLPTPCGVCLLTCCVGPETSSGGCNCFGGEACICGMQARKGESPLSVNSKSEGRLGFLLKEHVLHP